MIAAIFRLLAGVFSIKVFASGIMMTVLGVVLYNVLVQTVEEVLNFALVQINGVESGSVASPTITGFAGWFLAQVKIPEAFSIMIACIAIKFTLRKIPFLKW